MHIVDASLEIDGRFIVAGRSRSATYNSTRFVCHVEQYAICVRTAANVRESIIYIILCPGCDSLTCNTRAGYLASEAYVGGLVP